MRYSPLLHARQWWHGWRGRHVRYVCLYWLLGAIRAFDTRGWLWGAWDTLWAVEREVCWNNQRGFIDLGGGLGMGRVEIGYRAIAARAWYESNRPTVPAPLRTRYVDSAAGGSGDGTSGNPWTVAQYISGALAGDKIYFRGTWTTDYLAIGPPVTGTSSNYVQLVVWPGYTASFTGAYCYLTDKHYVVIDGLTMDAGSVDITALIYAVTSTDLIVRNCTLSGGNGVFLGGGCHRAWVYSNTLSECGAAPPSNTGEAVLIKGTGQSDVVVYNNAITTCGHMGISCARSATGQENIDCRIAHNMIANPWSGGIAVGSASLRTIVEGNDISDTGQDNATAGSRMGIQLQGIDAVVRYNRIWNTATQGITWFCSSGGGLPGPVTGSRVYHNTFYECGRTAQKSVLDIVNRADRDEIEFSDNWFDNNIVSQSGYFVYEGNQAFIYIEIPASIKYSTSTSSVAIGTGTKAFTVPAIAESYWTWSASDAITAVDQANSGNTMTGTVTSFVGTTLTISVASTTGSGTIASWHLNGPSIVSYVLDQWMPGAPSTTTRTLSGCKFRNNLFYRSDSTGTDKLIEFYTAADLYDLGLGYTNTWYTPTEAATTFGSDLVSGNVWLSNPSFVSTTDTHPLYLAIPSGSAAKDAGIAISGINKLGNAADIGVYEVG